MSELRELKLPRQIDWDAVYREGTPHWETGRPAAELIRVLESGAIRPRTVLELGCGTGADAIYLARQRLEVTAVDNSPMAIERARVRAEQEDVLPRFVLEDVAQFAPTAGQFDFIYDAGLYHYLRRHELEKYLDVLWRVTQPGSYYLGLCAAPREKGDDGPPTVTERQIYRELGRLLEMVELRQCRLASLYRPDGYPGWSCLMRRPMLSK
jgi:methyl halide transferase